MPVAQQRPVRLADIVEPARAAHDVAGGLAAFHADPAVSALRHWPEDVIEQWLYDHAEHAPFQADYGHIDLSSLAWTVEPVTLADLLLMPTGASETDLLDYFARDPEHWVAVRNKGCHIGVREVWEVQGTWKRWPILLDRGVVTPGQTGLQVVEGRTRVGVLRGRARMGYHVAANHLVWVGRVRS